MEVVLLVRDGAVIPQIALAQSTKDMDWSKLDLEVYASSNSKPEGFVCLPSENVLHRVLLVQAGGSYKIEKDPYLGKVTFKIRKMELKP